ncbi:MAG: phage tail-type lysozyme domain-containing protein [Lactobacillaceae bacterium]|jgi:hypothetical protein|nr:phage tail-type lysozyme domain-containing protein [Lactobacillaceae bacterium]
MKTGKKIGGFIAFMISPLGWITTGIAIALMGVLIFVGVVTMMFSMDDSSDCSTYVHDEIGLNDQASDNVATYKQFYDHAVQVDGFSGAGAAGMVAVLKRESGGNLKAVNDSGGVAGALQWSGWSSNVNGSRIGSEGSIKPMDESTLTLDNELKLMDYELNGKYHHAKELVGNATDPVTAAHDWSQYYEGVALTDSQSKLAQLDADAVAFYTEFNGSSQLADSGLIGGTDQGTDGITNANAEEAQDCETTTDNGSGADGYGLPVKGSYSLGTGTYPSYTVGSDAHDHNGVDFQSKGLTEDDVKSGTVKAGVYAVHNGTVTNVTHSDDEWWVIIKGTDGKYTYYGHAMVAPPVKEGDTVKRGQLITHQGYGGDVEPKNIGAAHVHFGIATTGLNFGPNDPSILSPADYLPLPKSVLPDGTTGGVNDKVIGSGFVTQFNSADTDKDAGPAIGPSQP